MKRRGWIWGTALFLLVACLLVLGAAGVGGSSSLSAGPSGWLAARLYLQESGVAATLLDRPFHEARDRGEVGPVLVVAFPLARAASSEERNAVESYLKEGGTVVAAYGELPELDLAQARFFEVLGAEIEEAREPAPLGPFAWRRWMREEWRLTPAGRPAAEEPDDGDGDSDGTLVLAAPTRYPAPGELEGVRVLYEARKRDGDGARPAAVWTAPVGEGRLVVLPAGVLSNAYLERPGNADLLEGLRVRLGDHWTFDEYHHGLTDPEIAEAGSPLAFDLFGLHLLLLYLLGLWTLARPFGPPWREPPLRTGSAGGFLRGLGRLHDALGHHAEAAQRLVRRARELDPRLALPDELESRAAGADADALVKLGREVAAHRRRGRGT